MQQIFGHSTTLLALPNILLGDRQQLAVGKDFAEICF